jgi:hypothetical protein
VNTNSIEVYNMDNIYSGQDPIIYLMIRENSYFIYIFSNTFTKFLLKQHIKP